jgi:putative transposase
MAFYNLVFNQFLSLVPRQIFSRIAKQHGPKRQPKKFTLWEQFVCLLFFQLTERKSLRACVRNMNSFHHKLYHLGVKPVAKSTFSDANNKRPYQFFAELFKELYQRCLGVAPKNKFNLKLFSLDSSTVDLVKSFFEWAEFRKSKSGIKLHTLLDHNGHLPAVVCISDAKTHDIQVARRLSFEPGSILVFDRGYNDYNWFYDLTKEKVYFVTRLKKNAKFKIIERVPLDKNQKLEGITSDHYIEIESEQGKMVLRKIGYKAPETNKFYYFLTNNFRLSAKTIADIYKERWQIELFFKWIKQNLKIKSFVGRSENAVFSQIFVAIIGYLLLSYLKFTSKISQSLQIMVQILQLNLFTNCNLTALFKQKHKQEKRTPKPPPLLKILTGH